jgi:DNA (cytosine-5)-methyltransferase 1
MGRTSVELFAGGGGLVQAAARAGFRPLLMNENAKRACETLDVNSIHGEADQASPEGVKLYDVQRYEEGDVPPVPTERDPVPLVAGDVQKLHLEYLRNCGVDLLAGGPPCQPFSLGGNSKGDEDGRNMFPEMFRAIRLIRPKVVICENVRGLLRASFRPYFEYIQRELEFPIAERKDGKSWKDHDADLKKLQSGKQTPADERYHVIVVDVNAADYGVPQFRQRVIMVAFRSDLNVDLTEFMASIRQTHSRFALIQSILDGSYWNRYEVSQWLKEQVRARVAEPLSFGENEHIGDSHIEAAMKPWRTLRDALVEGNYDSEGPLPHVPLDQLDRETEHGGVSDHVGWPEGRIYPGHTPNDLDRPAKTVKAGVHGVAGGELVMYLDPNGPRGKRPHRYMTVREVARVMTFPDHWKLKGPRGEKMRQLGNAVPVKLGEVFTKAVASALDRAEKKR